MPNVRFLLLSKNSMPAADRIQQYHAFTGNVGFCRLPRTLIEFRGSDRTTFLHNLCTNDIEKLQIGQGCEAFITNVQGKTIGHVVIAVEEDSIWLSTVPGQADMLLAHFDRYLITEDVQLSDRSDDWQMLVIGGAESGPLVSQLFSVAPPSASYSHASQQDRWSVQRVPFSVSPAFLVHLSVGESSDWKQTLTSSGAVECDLETFDSVRIESGYPEFGRDITDKNLPQEVDRDEFAISFTKGCYLGQETVSSNRCARAREPQVGSAEVFYTRPTTNW